MAKVKYRLALDMGANSLGWCVYRLDQNNEIDGIVRLGSRIFSDGRDPKSLASLAADRRLARQMRRRRDRVLKRRQRLIQGLIQFGLMPVDEGARKELQGNDPYVLRAKGLTEPLTLHELGRALYHLARKRGFRSSRKDGASADAEKETGKVKEAIKRLRQQIADAGCATVGEYLAKQHANRNSVRARRSADGNYVLYLQRDMVAEEFEILWAAQKRHYPEVLTDAARDYLRDTILFQRKLLPVRPGRCLFETEEYRAPLCSPLQQRFRILQELNNLRVKDGVAYRPVTLEERNKMLMLLDADAGLVTFSKLAKAAGLGKSTAFNLESERRKGLRGNATTAQFSSPTAFGEAWFSFDVEFREAVALLVERADQNSELLEALRLLPEKSASARDVLRPHAHELDLLDALRRLPGPLTEGQVLAISRIRLPDDFGSLSRKALLRIVPELEREVVTYDVAVQRAGYAHHSQLHTGEFFQRLPYYGEILRGYTSPADKARDDAERAFGKIANPTVHIGLNQLRQLVNALIKRYGHPHEVVIEVTREFGLSGERRRELERQQADNQKRNEDYDARLEKIGQRANRENRLKLQLWEELGQNDSMDHCCVYSGKQLSMSLLFSDEVEIDHILPFSKSLHDGTGNKILCIRQANRDKGNKTPFEAFGHSPGVYSWEHILERTQRLFAASKDPSSRRKAELFREDALECFLQGKDFLDRHLTDTAYLGRAAKQYLSYICHKDYVWVSSGKLIGMLRGRWGLNPLLSDDSRKNRNDHRHHALDAAVIGTCSRSVIQRMATAAARAEAVGESRLLETLELPWASFRDELRNSLQRVVVSHKPDHSREAALHNDTNYGLRGTPDQAGVPLVGRHVPLDSLKGVKDIAGIPDDALREQLRVLLAPLASPKEVKAALAAFTSRTGIRRVMKEERLSVIPISDRRTGKPYRYVKGDGNYCYEIFRRPDGVWGGEVISQYLAGGKHYAGLPTLTQSGKPLVMRLCKGDLMVLEEGTMPRVMRIAKFTEGMIALVDHNEANVDARARDKESGFKYMFKAPSKLKAARARLVGVDVLGHVNDRGFRE